MGKMKEIDGMIRMHFEELRDEVYKVKDEDIAAGKDTNAWNVVRCMESYLTALVDAEIMSKDAAFGKGGYYWEFYNWADYAWADDEEEE